MRSRHLLRANPVVVCLLLSLIPALQKNAPAQEKRREAPPTPGPMLAQGTINLDTPDFDLSLVRSSQTIASLKPKGAGGFDFTPGDLLVERSQNGYYHLGDLNLRLRKAGSEEWKNYSTSVARVEPSVTYTSAGSIRLKALARPLLPFSVSRSWTGRSPVEGAGSGGTGASIASTG